MHYVLLIPEDRCTQCRRKLADPQNVSFCAECTTVYCSQVCLEANMMKHKWTYCHLRAEDTNIFGLRSSYPHFLTNERPRGYNSDLLSRLRLPADGPSVAGNPSAHQHPIPRNAFSDVPDIPCHIIPPPQPRPLQVGPFMRLENGTYLHGQQRGPVFRKLFDAYRLRVADDLRLKGTPEPDSLRDGFRRFLEMAAQRPNFLPQWWDDAEAALCDVFIAVNGREWYNFQRRVSDKEINEKYDDPQMDLQLRFLAEVILGQGPGGMDGRELLELFARSERGGAIVVFFVLKEPEEDGESETDD